MSTSTSTTAAASTARPTAPSISPGQRGPGERSSYLAKRAAAGLLQQLPRLLAEPLARLGVVAGRGQLGAERLGVRHHDLDPRLLQRILDPRLHVREVLPLRLARR